jgi:hypothetical protein
MAIRIQDIEVETYHPIQYLKRNLEPLDIVTLWGIVSSVEDGMVEIQIHNVKVDEQKFSASTSNSKIYDVTVRIPVQHLR